MRQLVFRACALRFLDAFLLIVPFYMVMFAEAGLAPAQIGVVLGAWSVTGVALQIPFGVLADHFPRRYILFAGQLARMGGFVIWLAWPSFWGFLAGLVLWGVKSASTYGVFEALVYDELKALGREEEYARVIGRTQASQFAGAVGASLAGAAAAGAGLGYPAMVAGSLASGLVAATAALALPSAPRSVTARPPFLAHLRRGARDAIRLPGVLPVLVFLAAIQAVASACADYWQLFGREVGLPPAAIGIFIAALSATQGLASVLAHRTRSAPAAGSYILILSAGLVLIGAAVTFEAWSVVLVMTCLGFYRVVDVITEARFQQALRHETRATVAAVKMFAMQCGTTVLMVSFGLLAQASEYQTSFIVYGAILSAIGAAWLVPAILRPRRAA